MIYELVPNIHSYSVVSLLWVDSPTPPLVVLLPSSFQVMD